MKIQCDACEKAEAVVLCCADEAALCWDCDEKVHAANKLAGKHQRVPLLLPSAASATSKLPGCDICQEKAGYFFCLEDRALLCRHCDLTIHSASPFVSHHQRFLITGARVALQHYLTNNSSSNRSSAAVNEFSNSSGSIGNSSNPAGSLASTSLAVEKTEGFKPNWPWNEIFEGPDFDHC
ncbi:B-box zinc finger protein 22 [Dendrobium catenatum]|uniref:Putative salt tolerance-like protein n=1 Tax=Dendrobium catenatum TaxID=906689 RepID=A0A2I0XDG9_9ASPA|nr:B-box zinc finger protein 22 [Dendrobium catenatum]XP_020678799.1 B-box zinc finger protein 22 [Dendrobium catenatum]XP_020678801.1 B-box zinc finger protein 22 [Dendrobium catenatum]XP_028555242.1 B-box zinc finger protein 22 [Dendrobium catenatum]PKU85968.1 putative salt tolerance-like protein [Dendrobium catenatum]